MPDTATATITVDAVVSKYVKLRDLKAEKKSAYDDSVKDIDAAMAKCELYLLRTMQEMGLESVRTEAGTAYKTVKTSAQVADWDMALAFIRDNELWEMLEKRVSKKLVEQYKEEKNDLPPGINWREELTVNIRRS